jgi:hypothetical protein
MQQTKIRDSQSRDLRSSERIGLDHLRRDKILFCGCAGCGRALAGHETILRWEILEDFFTQRAERIVKFRRVNFCSDKCGNREGTYSPR